MVALEWGDMDLASDNCAISDRIGAELTTTKDGRVRYVPMTDAIDDSASRVPSSRRGSGCCARTRAAVHADAWSRVRAAARLARGCRLGAHPSTHVLLAPGDAGRARRAIQELAGHQERRTHSATCT